MHSPTKIIKPKNSSILTIKSQILKNNQESTCFSASTMVNNVKNNSHEIPSKINTPIEFIRQKKKFVLLNSFDKNWTKHFLEQKEKALLEIKLDDKILEVEENKVDTLECLDNMKNNNKKKVYSLYKKKSEDIINNRDNMEIDHNYSTKIKGREAEKHKNHALHKSSTNKIKIYDDNLKKWENLFIFSEKRKKLMRIDEDIEESSISRDNMENKNNIKLLGKNYRKILNEAEKEFINNSKIDTLRSILEELM